MSTEEDEYLGEILETGEKCPRTGQWEQVETGKIDWDEIGDKFPPLIPFPNYKKEVSDI